jgi:hypothetical protein
MRPLDPRIYGHIKANIYLGRTRNSTSLRK